MKHEIQPEGNYYDKYNSKNFIEKWLMKNFFKKCGCMLQEVILRDGSILEAGCGEGNFTRFLYQRYGKTAEIAAFDISRKCVQEAKRKCPSVDFWIGSIYQIPRDHQYDLVVASEVLEHMDEPERAVEELLEASKRYVFITVPNEPLWRILNMVRGKYWRRLGNTPGHEQHWNRKTLRKLIMRSGAEDVKISTACPWLMALIEINRHLKE